MDNNLVSIIMPAYNSQRFIGETIQSVLEQTYQDWELLITDDCSTDEVELVVASYAKLDSRVKYFKLKENSGPAVARNNSIANAKGRFLAFLDSDDLWVPEKLKTQLDFMHAEKCDFTYTYYQRIKEDGVRYNYINECPDSLNYNQLLKNTAISTLTVVVDRMKYKEVLMKKGWGYDDYVLWLDLLKQGGKAVCIPKPLAFYRVVESSVSSKKVRATKWVWRILREHENINVVKSSYYISCFCINAFLKRTHLNFWI